MLFLNIYCIVNYFTRWNVLYNTVNYMNMTSSNQPSLSSTREIVLVIIIRHKIIFWVISKFSSWSSRWCYPLISSIIFGEKYNHESDVYFQLPCWFSALTGYTGLSILFWNSSNERFNVFVNTLKPQFNAPWFYASSYLIYNLSDPKSMYSVLNYLHIRYFLNLVFKSIGPPPKP